MINLINNIYYDNITKLIEDERDKQMIIYNDITESHKKECDKRNEYEMRNVYKLFYLVIK